MFLVLRENSLYCLLHLNETSHLQSYLIVSYHTRLSWRSCNVIVCQLHPFSFFLYYMHLYRQICQIDRHTYVYEAASIFIVNWMSST